MAFRKLSDFIQEDVIVALIIDELRARNVAQFIVDTKYQEELGKGSSYKVPGITDLTVNSYDGTVIDPEDAASYSAIILLDKYPFINFYLEDSDVNETTAMSLAVEYAKRAAEQIASDIDLKVLATIDSGAQVDSDIGVIGTPISIATSDDALNYVETFATTLREANIETGAIVLPPFVGMKVARALGTGVNNERIAGNGIEMGYIESLFGFDIYTSTNLKVNGTEFSAIGGKRETFHLILGTTIAKSGDSERKPATFNQFGQVYGADFSNANGWYTGKVAKA